MNADAWGMQVSRFLRRAEMGHVHWCPACDEMHMIPDTWAFDGNVEKPTFTPSVKLTANYGPLSTKHPPGPYCCHYNLIAGELHFHGDCTHAVRGVVPLPELPEGYRDE